MFRRLVLHHPRLAAALTALALAMKVAVPAGFMPVAAPGQMMVLVCTEFGPQQVAIDVPGMPAKPDDAAKMDPPCAFAGLGLAWLPGADAVLLAAALVFILALGFVAVAAPRLVRPPYLRPPLRGPPTTA
ncbi:hypothetical protein DAH55_06860 [Sphingomonas koreensis]|uniref:hypothetical protein n=1 Tax=Sphingomonas koreensis TaxID=93064 RepID=UPI00082A863F|nr:hypothetical protein [Sphingomonas koreensis]PJI90014.1 hypothetical protein BDW16_3335 [Sphingomonas koreensis]RSU62532.1 hypothetical protein DAH56_04820 [Sphingomonas koreensis]RSU70244.1 hypothetical protein DAH55_06860 [Sphingomonas koreensis]